MSSQDKSPLPDGWYRPKAHPELAFKLADVSWVHAYNAGALGTPVPSIDIYVGAHEHTLGFGSFQDGDAARAAKRDEAVVQLLDAISWVE